MQSKRVLERNLSGGSFLLYRKKGPALPALDAGKQQQGFESGVKRARMHSQSSSDDGGKCADQAAPQHKRRAASPANCSAHTTNPNREQQDELIAQLLQQSPALTATGCAGSQQQHNMPVWRQLLIAALLQKACLPVLDEAAAAALPVPEPVLQQKAAAAAAARQASSGCQETADAACKSSWVQGGLTAESTEQRTPCAPQAAAAPTPGAGDFNAAVSSQPGVQPLTQQAVPATQHSQQQATQPPPQQAQQQPVQHALQHLVGLSDIVHAALSMPGVLEAAPLPAWARPARAALPAAEFAELQMSLPAGADLVAVMTDILTAHHQVQAALADAKQMGLLDTPAAAAAAAAPAAAAAACADACAPAAAAGAYSFCDSDTSVNTAFGGSFSSVVQPHSSCAHMHTHSSFTRAPACSAQAVANALVVKTEAAAVPATPPAARPFSPAAAAAAAVSAAGGVVQQLGAAYSQLSACSHGLTCLLLLEAAQHKQQQQQQQAAAAGPAVATAGTAAVSIKAEPIPTDRTDAQQQQQQQSAQARPRPQLEQQQPTDRLVSVAQKVLKVAEGAAGVSQEDKLQLLSAVAELLVVVQESQTQATA